MRSLSASQEVCRILLCEDSLVYATALARFLEQDPDLRVVARCVSGEEAMERVPSVRPDLVIMDVELPGIDGVEATRRLMASRPVPVLVISAHTARGSHRSLAALAAGAADARPKSDVPLQDPTGARAVAFRRYVKRLSAATIARRTSAQHAASRPPRPWTGAEGPASVIGIAASTGGPPALRTVLAALPREFPLPIVVVQHIADGFLGGLIRWLDGEVPLPVGLAREGAVLGPGVWVAPDDAHVVAERDLVIRLDRETVAGYHRPAADILFVSLASAAGARATGVVLTGMGSDGAEGAAVIARCGGLTIAQDEPSSTVYGMPREAARLAGSRVLPLAAIGPTLRQLARARPPR